MRKNVRIKSYEIGLSFRHGDLRKVLGPGTHRIWTFGGTHTIDVFDTLRPKFTHEHVETLARDSRLASLLKVVDLKESDVALVWIDGRLSEVLDPGLHAYWKSPRIQIDKFNTGHAEVEHPQLADLVGDERFAPRVEVVDLAEDDRAIVWVDGRIHSVLGPGLHAFWKSAGRINVERYNVNDDRLEHDKLEAIVAFPQSVKWLNGIRVDDHDRVMLFRDGSLVGQLDAGHFVYWRGGPAVTWKAVDMREQVSDVQGQEIMTQDKVTLRMNLLVTHRVTDPVQAVTGVADWSQSLYREAQLGLRAAVGGRTLDKLLTDKDEVGNEIKANLGARASEFGVTISSVGLRDIILPGDMKVILNEVIVAQKQAEANVIRRREETAAARSQANTARLLSENPALARMKELEALQEILADANVTFVLGSGDLADQVRGLTRTEAPNN